MTQRLPTAFVLVLTLSSLSTTSRAEVTAKNTIYVEGLGPAGLYSLNYERRVGDFNGRVGFTMWTNSIATVTTVPVGFNYIGFGGKSSHLELGGVVTTAFINGDSQFGDTISVFGSALVGYRFQPESGGFNFRAGASPLLGEFGLLPWTYLSLGATF